MMMNKSLLTILILSSFSVFTEASSSGRMKFLKFLSGYGPWNNPKRVLPAGLKQDKEDTDEDSFSTALNTPDSGSADNQQAELESFLGSKLVVKPGSSYNDNPAIISVNGESEKSFLSTISMKPKKRKLGQKAAALRKLLFPTVSKGVWDLSEASALELLKLKFHAKVLIDDSQRFDFLMADLQRTDAAYNKKFMKRLKWAREFDKEIGEDLKGSAELKDFLKVMIKFYSRCFEKLMLSDCITAIMKSQVFSVEEMPEIFGMSEDELFQSACKNDIKAVALDLIRNQDPNLDLIAGAMAAKKAENDELLSDLVNLVGEIHGTDSDGPYHTILYEILLEEIH